MVQTLAPAEQEVAPADLNRLRRATRKEPHLGKRITQSWSDYLYVAPAILVMAVVIGYPLVYTIYLSFFRDIPRTGDRVYDGISNYQLILNSDRFWDVTKNTFVWTIFSTGFAFLLGLGAALMIHKEFIGRGIVRGLLLIPWVISYVAAAYVWRWLFHSDFGLINGLLVEWGIMDDRFIFLDSTKWVMPSLIITNVWKEFPFVMIMVLAGLQTVPEQLLRAARIDGANSWNQFIHVTVPQLKNVIFITLLLLFVTNLNSFGLVWIMTGGGPANASNLWILEIYKIAFRDLRYGLASSFSVILFVFMLAIGYFYVRALTGNGSKRSRA